MSDEDLFEAMRNAMLPMVPTGMVLNRLVSVAKTYADKSGVAVSENVTGVHWIEVTGGNYLDNHILHISGCHSWNKDVDPDCIFGKELLRELKEGDLPNKMPEKGDWEMKFEDGKFSYTHMPKSNDTVPF